MELIEVKSKNLSKVGYDKESKTLIIIFNHGSQYQFDNVPEFIFDELIHSPSIGTFFSHNVRNRFPFKKIF